MTGRAEHRQYEADYYADSSRKNQPHTGNLSAEDELVLGFGDQRNYQPAFVRQGKPTLLHRIMSASNGAQTRLQLLSQRISARLKRLK